jgi:hypothetical protein
MIWAIGLACAAGILIFHLINLARFRRQAFNQFELVARIARQNRVIRNVRAILLLLNRLAFIGCLTLFVSTCAYQDEEGGSIKVLIPKLSHLSKPSLGVVDSLINRSGLANATKSNFVTDDIRLKSLFPTVSYQPALVDVLPSSKKLGFEVDSLRIQAPSMDLLVRMSDTSFRFQNESKGINTLTVNGKTLSEDKLNKPLVLNQEKQTEVNVNNEAQYYFLTKHETPIVYLASAYNKLNSAFSTRLFQIEKDSVKAKMMVGASDFKAPINQKAILYIPKSAEAASKDLALLGVTAKLSAVTNPVADTFDVVDKAYFSYALQQGADAELPILKGRVKFKVEGYAVPVMSSSSGAVLASVLPNARGNTVLFLHTSLSPAYTNLAETELFLPLLYSLAQSVTQTGKVTYYDLCDKAARSALTELTATADSIHYVKGFAKAYLPAKTERILAPGIYATYKKGDSTLVGVNEISCKRGRAIYAYILREGTSSPTTGSLNLLLALIVTFACVEGLLLTHRFRRTQPV